MHPARLSVCGHNRVRSVFSTILARYYIYIYTSYQTTSEGVSRVKVFFSKFEFLAFFYCRFHIVFFCLGIRCESIVLVIMGRRGYSRYAGVLVALVRWWSAIIKSPRFEMTLGFQFLSAAATVSHTATTFASHLMSKLFERSLIYLGQRRYKFGEMY